jgi:DNA modification methylase
MYELNKLYNLDCMEVMRNTPDKYFDLAIVDPPYGGGATITEKSPSALAGGGQAISK